MKAADKRKMYELKKKSPGAAAGASILMVGLGHLYLGKIGKAILLFIIMLALWLILLGWIMWIITPVIAYFDAKKHNAILRLELEL